ncbi:carboxypeptidase-like regulatory domain-containing protein [Acidisarcina polymorpha]|uniref:carboxypeptidase-like regulatory domain-containing protein n=1 Tax=Acidisarcina polymorpha TaxID=2211140 RepID=UPI000DEF7056
MKRLCSIRVAALLCSFALLSPALAFQSSNLGRQAGSISGRLLTDTGHPVQGTAVSLLNTQKTLHLVAQSDASGAYVFSSLPAGQYLLLAFHPGYFAEYFNMGRAGWYPGR